MNRARVDEAINRRVTVEEVRHALEPDIPPRNVRKCSSWYAGSRHAIRRPNIASRTSGRPTRGGQL